MAIIIGIVLPEEGYAVHVGIRCRMYVIFHRFPILHTWHTSQTAIAHIEEVAHHKLTEPAAADTRLTIRYLDMAGLFNNNIAYFPQLSRSRLR